MASSVANCPSCSSPLNEGANFCIRCGSKVLATTGVAPPPILTSAPPPIPASGEAEKRCSDCRHRQPRYVCGSPASPYYGKTVEASDYCDSFLLNPAQIHSTNASVLSLEERTADAIKEFEMALQLGLPQDDEMKDHFFLGGLYLDTLMSSGISGRDFSASPLFAKAISEMEKALVMDREGGYQYFFEVLNRARLRRLDLLYTLAANSILEHQSRKAAIAFLQRKTGLCVYLPTCPLLNVLFNLAAFCSAEGQTESAKICLKNLLASETVDPVDENGQEAKTRQRALDHLRSPG